MGQSLVELITPDRILPVVEAADKAALLAALARRIASAAALDPTAVEAALAERERLSSTGVGSGIAIPHAQVPGLARPIGLLARLQRAVEFGAEDGLGVDLVVVVLAPEGAMVDQLKALGRVARVLRHRSIADQLREASGAEAIHGILGRAERELGPP
ncbi:MAG: PTS sugar transporter subunit IIA [Rhodospirillales bacterium]|nr:PTS sugar transporter subunit IIA [Rhodospirillales bacterium]